MSLVKNITKKSYNDRLNTTIFYINIFLILVHVFLSVFYMLAHHNLMIIVNLFSIILYLVSFLFCFKHKKAYLNIAFVEIWIHMLLSFCSFGWEACFQNWIFALVAAVFLPAFSPEHKTQSYKQSYIFSFIIVLSYFIFAWITNTFDLIITIKLETYLQNTLFFFNNMVAFLSIILFAVTYTKNKESKEFELIRKANFDELTDIYNRHAIDTIMEDILIRKESYSVAIIDIDSFKLVNDTYGHKSGDMVLKDLGRIISSYSNKDINVGRWGGEEFIIIANKNIYYNDFISLLEDLRITVSKNKFIIKNRRTIHLTVSIGSKNIKNSISLENSVSLADKNLYKAKEQGKNRVIS